MDATLLIVTGRWDYSAHVAGQALRKLGHDPVFLYPEDIPDRTRLTARFHNASWSAELRTPEHVIDLDTVRSIWWRKPVPARTNPDLPDYFRDYVTRETQYALTGIWRLLHEREDVYWMSDPACIKAADNKMLQRYRAAEFGFASPKTLLTNDPDEVRRFYDECDGKVVFKSMSGPVMLNGEAADLDKLPKGVPLVRPLTRADLSHVDDVRHNPCEFQELVPKARELRVTVFDDKVFTCAIDSQSNPLTRFDWRNFSETEGATMSAAQVDPTFEKACVEYMRDFGLNFAAFDFIETPDGDTVFLEMNPNGQWLFVQMFAPELRLMPAFVDSITRNLAA